MHSEKKYNTVSDSYEYISIPSLNQYNLIAVRVQVGDAARQLLLIHRNIDEYAIITGNAGEKYHAVFSVYADFKNNKLGMKTSALVGWTYSNVFLLQVFGLAKS